MDLGLHGKVAIVTGGSEGIGKAAAASMAAEGTDVVIAARRADVLESAAAEIRAVSQHRVVAIPTDVMEPDQVQALIDQTMDEFGRVDILVNNAGTSAGGPFLNVSDEGWQHDLDLKLYGAIRTSRLAVPIMRDQGGGRIINVSSPTSENTPSPGIYATCFEWHIECWPHATTSRSRCHRQMLSCTVSVLSWTALPGRPLRPRSRDWWLTHLPATPRSTICFRTAAYSTRPMSFPTSRHSSRARYGGSPASVASRKTNSAMSRNDRFATGSVRDPDLGKILPINGVILPIAEILERCLARSSAHLDQN